MLQKDVLFSNEGFKDNITNSLIFCQYCKRLIAKFKIGRTFCCSESKIKCSYFQNLVEKAEQRKEEKLFTTKGLEEAGVPKDFLKIWNILGKPNCELCGNSNILQVGIDGTLPHLVCINNPKDLSIFNKDNWLVTCSFCYFKIKYNEVDISTMSKKEIKSLIVSIQKQNSQQISKFFENK